MDVNSRDPSQNIIPFRIKGVEVARFDISGNLGIGTSAPSANLDVVGTVKINGDLYVNGTPLTSLTSGVVVNMDSQPAPVTALNRQKKQSIPLAAASTLSTSDIIAKMSGVSVGKTQVYGVGPAQMATYGNIVVAVGLGTNSIAYSLTNPPTAASWVGIPNSTATFMTQGNNITYANGTWVAVGEGTNSIAYSTSTPPVASSWVGIRSDFSFNGVVNTFSSRSWNIAYGNGVWVAVGGATNSIAYSLANPPTAESWVGIPLSFSPTVFNGTVYGITFGNGTWVATGYGNNGIAYSVRTPPTADSWIGVPITLTNDNGNISTFSSGGINITYANGVWLASGQGTNTLCYSIENPPIAGSWMPITTGVLFGNIGYSIAYGNGTWVACGTSGTLLAYSTSRIPHSSSWVAMKGPTPSSSSEIINNISFNAATNTWYFLGDIGSNCMFYSTATPPVPATWIGVQRSAGAFTTQAYGAVGITTHAFTSPVNVARLDNKVTFPANRMLAVGGGGAEVIARSANTPSPATTGTISYSDDDGATWAMVPGGATNAMFSSAADIAAGTTFGVGGSRGANAVAWNGEKWVAAGNGRTHSLAFSDDGGMTWTGITGKSVFSVEARDVAWNGQMWVAVGRGINFSTAYSYDGVTWMGPVTDDISGTTINVFSFDIAGPSAAISDISGGGNHVIWTGKMWVATGTRTLIAGSSPPAYYTVAYSMDGKSWTGVPESGATNTGFDIYAHGIAWNGRNFIATGRGTVNTLAYFTDATVTTTPATWQGLGNTVFSVWGRGITWGARRWMATGRGTNTVAYSTNGRNWQGCGANVFKPMRRFMAMGDTGLYGTVQSGQPQRGVAFSYSDDGITWDAPIVNQSVEFSAPLGGATDTTRSVIFANNNILLTNAITDTASSHTGLMYSTDAGASWARVPGTSDTEANGGTGMTVANNGSYSLAMNPARTRFLVGGGDSASATRKVYFSNDGFNWRNGISSPNSSQFAWVSAAFWVGGGYNRWLIGGSDATTNSNGRILYSGNADAVTAWVDESGAFPSIVSCFAANTDFSVILAGSSSANNTIYRSVNGGANWTTISIGSSLGSTRSIAFSPSLGRWVAVGGSSGTNTIIYSTNATGTAWTVPPQGGRGGAAAIFKDSSEVTRVIWDAVGGRFLVGGWNGQAGLTYLTNVFGLDATTNNNPGYTMAYSADGINWTPVTVRVSDDAGAPPGSTSGTSFGPFLNRCREIMALDMSGDFTPINTGYTVSWNSYANRFVATGNGTTPVVYSSDGGVTWTPANQQPPQQAIAVAGGLGGTSGSTTTVSPITYTIDGKTWSQGIGAKEIFGTSGTVLAIKYGQTSTAISPNGRIWVAGGNSLAFSQNGVRWTAITGAATMISTIRAITYAPPTETLTTTATTTTTASSGIGNGVWVAGGNGVNSLVFSYDGISWSEVPNSPTILSQCNAIAFGGGAPGVFVAGGIAATGSTAIDTTANMAYSTDGLNWQPIRGSSARIASGANISCITYGRDETGRGLWVAGAFGSNTISILYSYNGIDWTGVAGSGTVSLSSNVTGLAYGINSRTGQGLWVASVYAQTSVGHSFLFSANGRDGWASVPNTKTGLFEVNTSGATGISYLNGVWYATGLSAGVSTGRTLAYSYEGSSGWFGVYPTTNIYGTAVTTFSTTEMRCVATSADYAIPMATTATTAAALTPVRGLGWTAGAGSAYIQHPTLLFGGGGGDSSRGTANSADGGRSWGSSAVSLSRSAFRGGVCNDAFWNGAVWAAVGYDAVTGAKVATSKDGVTWTQIPAGSVPIAGILYFIMWNGRVWMVGGDGSPTNDANTNSIAWSPDLATWIGIANTDTKLRIVKRIAWNGMYWVAVGAGDVSTIMHSVDKNGLKWEDTYLTSNVGNKTANITTVVNDVVWGGGRWVAVGRGNSVLGGGGVSILYSADTPEVVGVGAAAAEYAIKGRRWTGVASSAQLFPYGANSVCWNGKRFVATGPASATCSTGNIIAWSADGISWNAYSSAKTVAPGQRWVAVGSGSRACIALSADGRVWTDVSGSALLFSDISGASANMVSIMKTGARAIGWNGNSLVVGGARSATTVTATSQLTATATTGRTTIPVCAFIGSGNGVMGGGTMNVPDASFQSLTMRASSSVFITHMDVNTRDGSAPWANMWLNTYTDLSGTQLFQVTPETQTFSSALKWNGWSWVANFGMTTMNPTTGEQYGTIWYCTDPLARVGWSVASNNAPPRILMGQGGYAALEWNGVAWLACGYDPNNNNLIYTTDRYGATGWTSVSGIVSGGSAAFQPVCIASSPRFWVVGGSLGAATSAMYYTSDRTGATGWRAIMTSGLPGIRITSVGYNGAAWICCGGGGGGSVGGGASTSSISWRADTGTSDIGAGWSSATISGSNGGIPPIMSRSSAIAYNAGAGTPIWVVVGDVSGNVSGDQIAYTTDITGASEWKKPTSGTLTNPTYGRLNGIAWTGYSWIATSGAGSSRIASTTDITAAQLWNTATHIMITPTLCTNAVAYVNIPISLLTTGMPTSAGSGAGTGAMWRGGVGRAQGLLPGGGGETTSVIVRSANGAEGTRWSQVYSRNFLIAVGGGVIRDASGVGGTNRMAYSYDGGLSWTTNNSAVLTTAALNSIGSIRTVKYGNGMWVAGGDSAGSGGGGGGGNCIAWSRDGVNWTGAGGTQIFGGAGACYAVCCNDRGRWVAVGGAALGTAGTYTNTSGAIYTMAWSDDGMNWTPILGSRALFGIVCQGVSYGVDASGVGMWMAIGRGTAYTGCAYSYDAKNWYLSQTSGSLFGTSANVLTERYAPVASAAWRSVSLSSTGQYQTAVIENANIWTSSDYGVSWIARTTPGSRAWYSVSLSSTGQYQTAGVLGGNIWTSSDYGVSWTSRATSLSWISVSLSSTGQYQTATVNNGNIWTSSDYGVNWAPRTTSLAWYSVSVSSTGQYQTAVADSANIWTSSDYGVNWTSRATALTWRSVSVSSTGQYQTAVVYGGNIWTSSNYGVTWSSRATSLDWRSVYLSSTGQYQTAAVNSGNIWTSSNYGVDWTSRATSLIWYSVSLSSTGQYQTAVAQSGAIFISSNFGETWSSGATDSRSLGVAYGKDTSGAGMWVVTAGRRDRDVATSTANTMAYSYDGKLWRGITASAGLSEQAWSVAYGKDGFGVGMWVCAGYDTHCGLKWSYDGVSWNATMGASGAAVWAGMAAGRRALSVYWNGSMWLASTSDTRNGEPRGTGIAANNASGVPGYLLYSYNGKNWLPVLAPNTYAATVSASAQPSVYSVLPNPVILDFGSFYDDQTQRGVTIANTTARTGGAVMSGGVPIENINTIVPYGRGSLTTGQVPFLLGGDSGLMDLPVPPLYTFTSHTFTNAGQTGRLGPELATVRSAYMTAGATWATTYINMTTRGIQEWTVPETGSYTIRAVGAAGGNPGTFGRGRDIQLTTTLTKGEVIKILVGQQGRAGALVYVADGAGGGGTFVVTGTQTPIIVAGGGGGRGAILANQYINSNANNQTSGNKGGDGFSSNNGDGGSGGGGGSAALAYAAGGGGLIVDGQGLANVGGGVAFIRGGLGGSGGIYAGVGGNEGGFGGGGAANSEAGGGGGGGYSGGGGGRDPIWASGGGGGSFPSTATDNGAINTGHGSVTITLNTSITLNTIPITLTTTLPITSDLASTTASLSTSVDGGITWRAVPNSTRVMTKVNKILCDETTQQIVAVGTGNYSVATSTLAKAADADGWTGVFGSRMTDTRAGLFEKYGTAASWFGGAKMWIASGRAQTRRGSSLAVSVNGTVWQDAKIVSQVAAGGGGLVSRTTGGAVTTMVSSPFTTVTLTNPITTTITTNITRTTTPLTFNSSVIPYTAPATPLLTYTDSAAAFSTQVSSIATNSQYNRAVVGGSGVQFVAGGRGGLVVSNDGQNWTAAAGAGAATVFQTPTNVTTRTGGGGFDASFGTVALTQRLTTPATYPSGTLMHISLSKTGQYQSAVTDANAMNTSSDYGVSWTFGINMGLSWFGVSLSSTGQYQTAVATGNFIWTSSDFGVSWTSRATGMNWQKVSLSSTGQYQTAVVILGNIWTSVDYGISWSERTTGGVRQWYSVSLSSTGQYQSAVVIINGSIWISSDYGVSWLARTAPGSLDWRSISVSSTGQYQTAVVNAGNIWTSVDYGISWTERTTGATRTWFSVSLSSTGQYQSAVANAGNIWTSSDYGISWTERTAPGTWQWRSVSLSSTGQYQSAVATAGFIYTSTDFGATWVQRSTATRTNAFTRIRSSASGQYQIATSGPAGNTNGQLYVSSDYGQSWIPRRGLGTWLGGAVSATGAVMTTMTMAPAPTIIKINGALSYSPILYLDATNPSSYNGSTWTNLGSLGGNVLMTNMGSFDATDNGGSFNFNGTSNYGTLSVSTTNLTSLTYMAVVKASNLAGWRTIIDLSAYQFTMTVVGGVLRLYVSGIGQGNATFTLTPNIWYSLAFTISSSGTVIFYVNGVSINTSELGSLNRSGTVFGIGGTSTGLETWNGKISSLAAYNRVLTASEIYNLYISTAPILRSTDFGNTFTDVPGTTLVPPAYWRAISVSNSAAVQTAVAYGGSIYRSLDTGATWSNTGITIDGNAGTNTATPRNWQDIAVSAETGAIQVTCVSGGYLYLSTNTGASWSSTISFNGGGGIGLQAWQAVAVSADGQYGLACVNSTTAAGFLYRSVNWGTIWSSSNIVIDGVGTQTTNRSWQDVGMSANGKYQVACTLTGSIFYSKDYGASWFVLTAAGSRAWSSIALSENGSTISATTNDATGGVWVYAMPDEQYYRAGAVANSGSTTTPSTIRAITYGNSGTGATTDGYWVAGADASANSIAYSSNGMDWTAVVGSKTTLFNAVNGVAYGADGTGTPLWVAVGAPFVGSVPGTTAFSIAYSYNMTTWVGVRNAANFTGQGNHVAYGQDEFGAGVWVAVGQSDGVLAANLGDSALYNSNGTPNTTIFYSYDGANWAAGTGAGIFAVSGTDIAWGVDASGVGTWVATGIGFTDPTTGAVIAGGQVAHSTNGRVWTPIRAPASIVPAMSPATIPANERRNVIPAPPTSTGFAASLYTDIWRMLGGDIDGEALDDLCGYSVALSADGTTLAIGAPLANNPAGTNNVGHVRVYKYNPNKTAAPAGWEQLGADIVGEAQDDQSGFRVALSADGTTLAIGAPDANTDNTGHARVYKYNPNKSTTPVGWEQLGADIDGEALNDRSGWGVALSADGTTLAIGARYANTPAGTDNVGHVRVYKYNPAGWGRLGEDIDGEAQDDYSGTSVALSADGTTVAIGAIGANSSTGLNDSGHVRVYKYNPNKTVEQTNQSLAGFGPVGWDRLGADIDGETQYDYSGTSVALSADGTTLAIGAIYAINSTGTNNVGHVRVYKYKTIAPAGWEQLGADIDGEAQSDESGTSIALSADGTTLAIGARYANTPAGTNNTGHVRVYKYNPNKITTPVGWDQLGVDIDGENSSDESGFSVALSADGSTLAIGAPYANTPAGLNNSGHVRVYKLITAQAPATFSISNPAIADIENGGFIVIKSGASGSATITAVQPASPPFTFAPVIVQGTLTVSGSVYTLVYDTFYPIFTPFPGAVAGNTITVAYGRAGSQGAGAPLWIVGGAGTTNVFARSSLPSAITTAGAWSVVANTAPSANAPFAVCNSIGYSNGVWVAGNNTDATNILARSTDGGTTWTPVTASSVSGIIAGAAAVGANAFCNYSLAVADYSNDTNLRSWIAVQGTKNFFFEGGVSAVATVTPNIVASTYNSSGGNTRAWWVAGGVGLSGVAALGYTTDPSGATGWTKSASSAIANLATVNAVAFSPHTQRWIAVGAGPTAQNILTSDASGATWAVTPLITTHNITLNTCVWNQLPAAASAAGRWLAGGERNNGGGVTIPNSASVYISTDVSGSAVPWTPITGTGAILLQVYSLAYNGTVWIAAGMPATNDGSTSTLMRTADPAGATGWHGITATNSSTGGFDTAARSVSWNADQQMWVATGENTGATADAAFSSVIYSLDINGSAGTWRTVRESNSLCFSGEGTGIAFTGDKWFASGEGTRQIVATTGTAATSWTPVAHGTALTRASDIAYTGRRLIASGAGAGATNGIILSSDNTGTSWTPAPAGPSPGFTDASGGGTSVNFEASYEGVGRVIATGRSATNAVSVSVDGGTTWTAPTAQFSSVNTVDATTASLFTTGGNSVAYVGNDTLFAVGGNDVHWTGKRWVAVGVNSGATAATTTTPLLEIVNNNTTPVATSDDGITWQGVRTSQAPNLSDGTFVATNARIGATPLINSQITIADGGDTEGSSSATDYAGGIGTGIAQIDIIAELTPVSHAAFSVSSGTVGIIGAAGNGGVNSVGNAPNASFDTTAFTITTRPM